jgi:hypothetical protein
MIWLTIPLFWICLVGAVISTATGHQVTALVFTAYLAADIAWFLALLHVGSREGRD